MCVLGWGLGWVLFCFSFLGNCVGVGLGLGLRNRIDDGFGFGKTACAWAVVWAPIFLSPMSLPTLAWGSQHAAIFSLAYMYISPLLAAIKSLQYQIIESFVCLLKSSLFPLLLAPLFLFQPSLTLSYLNDCFWFQKALLRTSLRQTCWRTSYFHPNKFVKIEKAKDTPLMFWTFSSMGSSSFQCFS